MDLASIVSIPRYTGGQVKKKSLHGVVLSLTNVSCERVVYLNLFKYTSMPDREKSFLSQALLRSCYMVLQ